MTGVQTCALPISSKNWTPATPTLSEALAVTVTMPLTVAPFAGAAIDTVGGAVSLFTTAAAADAAATVSAAARPPPPRGGGVVGPGVVAQGKGEGPGGCPTLN